MELNSEQHHHHWPDQTRTRDTLFARRNRLGHGLRPFMGGVLLNDEVAAFSMIIVATLFVVVGVFSIIKWEHL